jgi:DNA-binding PadR family transcriptional regulator
MTSQSILGTFEQLVLSAILQVGEDAYAPSVLRWLEETTGRDVNRGSLYVTIERMEKKGLLRSWRGDPREGRGGRPRRYLEVTRDGREALQEARSSLLASWEGIDALLEEGA